MGAMDEQDVGRFEFKVSFGRLSYMRSVVPEVGVKGRDK